MTEIELITKALKDAYKFVKEQEQTKETGELLINLFKAEILVKNCSTAVVGHSEQLSPNNKTKIVRDFDNNHNDSFRNID